MRTVGDLRAFVRDTWHDSDVVTLCDSILAYMERAPKTELTLLTYSNLLKVANVVSIEDTLHRALNILTNSRVEALEPHFLFELEDGSEVDLSDDAIRNYFNEGFLVHPRSGEVVTDPDRFLIPYFSASDEFLALKETLGE